MLLCDSLVEAAARWDSRAWSLPVQGAFGLDGWAGKGDQYAFVAPRLQRAVRFVLDDRVMGNACAAIGARPTTLESCLRVLRVPYPLTWIEWRDPVRVAVREALGWAGEPNGFDVPVRMGVLLETDESGRRGFAAYAWRHGSQGLPAPIEMPDICPLAVRFDLDDPTITAGCAEAAETDIAAFERRWYGDPAEVAASKRTDRLARSVAPSWSQRYIRAFGALHAESAGLTRQAGIDRVVGRALSDMAGEFKTVISMLLMLTARNSVTTVDQAYGKLNLKRAKQGKPALLDHKVVQMRISGLEKRREGQGSRTNGRTSPHAHLVCGHFCVRKTPRETIYFRRGHQRGSGVVPVRTVHVLP